MRKKLLVFFSGLLFFIPSLFSQEVGKEPLSVCAKLGIALGVGAGVCCGGYLLYTRVTSTSEETKKRFEEDARDRARQAKEASDDRTSKAVSELEDQRDISDYLLGISADQKEQSDQRETLVWRVKRLSKDSAEYSEGISQSCRVLSGELERIKIFGENVQGLRLVVEEYSGQQEVANKLLHRRLSQLDAGSQSIAVSVRDQREQTKQLGNKVDLLLKKAGDIDRKISTLVAAASQQRSFQKDHNVFPVVVASDNMSSLVRSPQTPDQGNHAFWAARGRGTCRQEAFRHRALMGGH